MQTKTTHTQKNNNREKQLQKCVSFKHLEKCSFLRLPSKIFRIYQHTHTQTKKEQIIKKASKPDFNLYTV